MSIKKHGIGHYLIIVVLAVGAIVLVYPYIISLSYLLPEQNIFHRPVEQA
ncbi:MAG: hypothetical protein J7L71_07655 [Spirochaetaceae bacterium]|nr:hypothetical protein [Spirochaetaceae bacterium]